MRAGLGSGSFLPNFTSSMSCILEKTFHYYVFNSSPFASTNTFRSDQRSD
jgi:hypothetical protein